MSLAIAVVVASCSAPPSSESASRQSAALGQDTLAQVGETPLGKELVVRVARAQGISPALAVDRLVSEMVLARTFEERQPEVSLHLKRLALARSASERFLEEARMVGPATDDELKLFTERNWLQVDRPAAAATVHAVVLLAKGADDTDAQDFLRRLRSKLKPGLTESEFRDIARAEPAVNVKVRVESLPPVSSDGRVVDLSSGDEGVGFDETFARVANALSDVGELSDNIRTTFGLHLIMLTRRHPARHVPPAQLRKMIQPEIVAQRARALEAAALQQLRKTHPVLIERSAAAVTGLARVRE